MTEFNKLYFETIKNLLKDNDNILLEFRNKYVIASQKILKNYIQTIIKKYSSGVNIKQDNENLIFICSIDSDMNIETISKFESSSKNKKRLNFYIQEITCNNDEGISGYYNYDLNRIVVKLCSNEIEELVNKTPDFEQVYNKILRVLRHELEHFNNLETTNNYQLNKNILNKIGDLEFLKKIYNSMFDKLFSKHYKIFKNKKNYRLISMFYKFFDYVFDEDELVALISDFNIQSKKNKNLAVIDVILDNFKQDDFDQFDLKGFSSSEIRIFFDDLTNIIIFIAEIILHSYLIKYPDFKKDLASKTFQIYDRTFKYNLKNNKVVEIKQKTS